ncbi:MAG: 5'/3'-nucleotidase SurE [Desulfobulbaceae bacterium]|nr:5'/3'-nucleotidase SurE [Desulfobulbaceae bacterium]MCK5436526.1 5'/3'-nucleotidase SurE [Desulfobulbaceae bacterium]MCK5545717.1 5'/3'-nucleotidase SurE [Desulfobulbaceae bacterium]
MLTILVTNDDGVHAPGLKALSEAMQEVGRPVIIAPETNNSAVSHALTMSRPLRVKKIEPDVYSIDGTPTDCVNLGIGKVLDEKPMLLVSGINPGGNLGDDVHYSGTVSAAIEGTMLGIPSFAVSVAGDGPFHFKTAARLATELAKQILDKGLPRDTLLNVNVPNLPPEAVGDVRFTRQGRRVYEGAIKETFDPWGRKHFWIGGGIPTWDKGTDTDAAAILDNSISITPIHLDLTNHKALKNLSGWRFFL